MGLARCTLKVQGLDCPGEVPALRNALEGRPGVLGLDFDPPRGRMIVDYEPGATDPATLARQITERSGMRADPVEEGLEAEPAGFSRTWYRGWTLTAASGLALVVGLATSWAGGPVGVVGVAYGLAIVLGGIELFPKAIVGLRQRRLGIHLLMTLAILGAIALNLWDEAATVAFLFSLAEALEAHSLARARRAVRSLLEVAPETAERIEADGQTRTVPAAEVSPGSLVLVRAGDRVPVDGKIVAGRSSLDQKAITGESVPVSRGPGDEVFAGTVNGEGTLEVEATRSLGDSVVARTVELVRASQAHRSPMERSIERFASVYTPWAVAGAIALMVLPPIGISAWTGPVNNEVWRDWFFRGLVVLVAACPCALVIGTPVAVVCALASAARRGVLIKGGQFLEAFGRLRVLAFDKTGTLTLGLPDVVEVVPVNGGGGDEVLRIAAALGDRGGHVLGRAIARHARGRRLEIPAADDYQAVPGLGATGQIEATQYHIGNHRYIDESGLCAEGFHDSLGLAERGEGTAVALSAEAGPLGWIRLADRPRPGAASVLAELHALGIETVMLTGDNAPTAEAMARELGLTEHRAGLLPADKAKAIAEIEARKGPIGMVGDGVNDAPALAASRVGVALGGASSGAALEAADVVLMADDLGRLPWLVRHSRRALARIRQNIAIALGAKALVLILAALGMASLWMAIAADVGTTLIVVANALRLLRAPG
ncbi:heavy metal translocating P-type ATPase [soil metagenome]